MGHQRLGPDDNDRWTVGSEGCGELLGELFGGVCMYLSFPKIPSGLDSAS